MAFFVNSAGNLRDQICNILKNFFSDDKAEVRGWSDGKLYVKVKENAGFKDQDFHLNEEQIKEGCFGGGRIEGMDGKLFRIDVTEIKDWPWNKCCHQMSIEEALEECKKWRLTDEELNKLLE